MSHSHQKTSSETVAFYLDQARDQIRLAESTSLPARFRIHAAAAERWMQMAELAHRVEKRTVRP